MSLLACPWCGAALDAGPLPWAPDANLALRCDTCGNDAPVIDGVWHAMGPHRPQRSAAQLVNRLAPTAWAYERLWRHRSLTLLSGRRFPIDEELDELRACLKPAPGAVIVDVACSEGLYARSLAAHGATVLAVDHSLVFLRAAQLRAAAAGVRLVPVQALAQHLPVVNGAIDGTCMGGSLNEIGDRRRAVGEMARVSRSGAPCFVMSLVTASSPLGRIAQASARPSGIVFPTAADTLDEMLGAGFTVTRHRVERVVALTEARAAPDEYGG
jgi:hypothetical protein